MKKQTYLLFNKDTCNSLTIVFVFTFLLAAAFLPGITIAGINDQVIQANIDIDTLENNPVIKLSKSNFIFCSDVNDQSPEPQDLLISNIGSGILNWQINENCDWLEVSSLAGCSNGPDEVNQVTLSIITPPDIGKYKCHVIISDPCAVDATQKVDVTLYIYDKNVPEILYVPSEYDTIQAAINECNESDTVVLVPGTYKGSDNRDISYMGKAITVCSIDPDNPDVVAGTIINCQGGVRSGPHKGFIFQHNEDANSVLNGITITEAYSNWGGAISCNKSSPTIMNCIFFDNEATAAGGGIHLDESNPTIVNCIFRNNSSHWVGGAIRNHTSSPLIIHCLFIDNSAEYGGAMQNENEDSNPVIINCTFTDNIATNWAGGIVNNESLPVITNCIFWNNKDENSSIESSQIFEGAPVINYSCVQGWTGVFGGIGNIGTNPRFADAENDDYHLMSQKGRWDPISQCWVQDNATSECIDSGDPNSDWTGELWPHGQRINMGFYGGTLQASLSQSNVGEVSDLNNDGLVTWDDLMLLIEKWDSDDVLLREDLNLDGIVNADDLDFFEGNWEQDSNNFVPVLDFIKDQHVSSGEALNFSVSSFDNDNDELIYLAPGLPEGANFSEQEFSWIPETPGAYQLTVIVSDYKSLSYMTVKIIVDES